MASLIPCAVAIGPTCLGTLACKARVGGARWRSKVDELRWLIRVGRCSSRYTFQREGVEFGPSSRWRLSNPWRLPQSKVSPRYHLTSQGEFFLFRLDTIFYVCFPIFEYLEIEYGLRLPNAFQFRSDKKKKKTVVSAETQRGWRFHPVGVQYLVELFFVFPFNLFLCVFGFSLKKDLSSWIEMF
jgi:hypothetical protein